MRRAIVPAAIVTLTMAAWAAMTEPTFDGPMILALAGVAALLTMNYHLEKR